jgi:hypothetical protein
VIAMRTLLLAALCSSVCAAQAPAPAVNVTVASGKLAHHFLTNDLFHIDNLWIEVTSDTVFHRWLSRGINDKVTITLTANPEPFGDRANVRILSGILIHELAPGVTPIVHVMFLKDEQTGTLSAVTFETDDPVTALKFDGYDDKEVSIVIEQASAVR